VSSLSDEQLQNIVKEKLLGIQADGNVKQKAVKSSEVSRYLAEGWEQVASLPDKQVVIKLSS